MSHTHTHTHTHTHNGVLFSHKSEGEAVISYNMDELSRLYVEWNKPVTEG